MATSDHPPPFFSLPSELVHHVLSFLSIRDLLSVGLVNRSLRTHSLQDTLYQSFVQENVSGRTLSKPPNSTWRDLYISHHPFWFIAKHKVWFADNIHTGKLLIARYDHRIDAIEAYALVAERRQPSMLTWSWNPEAIIHTFSPHIQLDLNAPVVKLDANAYRNAVGDGESRLSKEIPMDLYGGVSRSTAAALYSRLMLTRPWPQSITTSATPVWPPSILPSDVRTRRDSPSQFRDKHHRPSSFADLSTKTFRVRKWMEFSSRAHAMEMRVGEDTTTWGTLPEECYTPTTLKPWQGIWCGDYAGHGCEFLAILQPDDPKPLPERAEYVMRTRERERRGSVDSVDSWATAPEADSGSDDDSLIAESAADLEDSVATLQPGHDRDSSEPEDVFSDPDCVAQEERIYRGRIEAIKLTGDPNIPRGEYTFIAPDIGNDGLIRIATEDIFKGARVVKSVGHIAGRGFHADDFMTSQLILISHDRLAQYWETYGHVSFYQRVNIDEFTKV
ncbi:F-box domain-containing protein [Dendryphion nanum]|uniref:F-box domain-containing protein n=1 Tax=Dendryphion nanum TaxID=256645 RepID=A0A9P9DIX3_9PLEO|nr:F-box domain-containing protein [Dendryphion nanum]